MMMDPINDWEINETSDWQIKVSGVVAIVVAVLRQKRHLGDREFDGSVKFSDIYILENEAWRNMHAHASRPVDAEKNQC